MRLLLSFHSIARDKNREQVPFQVTKHACKRQEPHVRTAITFPSKTSFSKIKVHLKLRHKSVGQGRGGMEGTVRPSQLRAGSPSKKRMQKKISLRGRQNTLTTKHARKRQEPHVGTAITFPSKKYFQKTNLT